MCSQSYIHQIDVPAHVQAGRYILTYGEAAAATAANREECPQYRQRVVGAIVTMQALRAALGV